MATLATVDDARAGPRSLENQGSGRHPLGRSHSGIYGDSTWTDLRTKLKIKLFLIETLAAVHTPLGPGRAHHRLSVGTERARLVLDRSK